MTFSGAQAFEPAASLGGAVLVINVPAMVIQYYPAAENTPGLVIAEAGQLTADVEGGATLDEVRSYLLSHPDLPAETVAQLSAITDPRTTLPVTVPGSETMRRDTTVAGGHALLFGDNSSHASTVIWQRDGRLHAVGGTLKRPGGAARRQRPPLADEAP